MSNYIEVPTQAVVGHKEVTTLPVPVPRWHALKSKIRLAADSPWVLQVLASACLGVTGSAGLALFTTTVTKDQKVVLIAVLIGSALLAFALYTAVAQQRKVKTQQVGAIIDMMDAVEEPFEVPSCPGAVNPTFAYRLNAAIATFKAPP
jgi:hypothetical protein